MKRVVLLGDSIRMGYQATVRAELADVAFVWAPGENGQHTVNELLHFWDWVVEQQPDVVHMNAGLWDTRRVVRNVDGNIVPPDMYRANVSRLIQLTRQHTRAKVIWATTTPINEARTRLTHLKSGLSGRAGADVDEYNRLAVDAAKEQGAIINDLHGAVLSAGIDQVLSADGVHFTEAGYELLGKQVAKVIRGVIGEGAR